MTDHPTAHLSDDWLNAFLEQQTLHPDAWPSAQAHLAACQPCRQRLDDLRALFASLDAVPDVPLMRDLAPGVSQALRRSRPAADCLTVVPRARLLHLLLPMQALAAAFVLALAWPLIATRASQLVPPALALIGEAHTVLRPFSVSASQASQWWAEAQRAVDAGWSAVQASPILSVPVQHLLAAVAGSGLLWLLMNYFLLQPRPGGPPRRTR